jgi:hypothetical protein
MNLQDQLYFFREILQEVQVMFPGATAVIGGGALRDAYHDRPIKDVDVFLRAKDFPNGLNHRLIKQLIPPSVSSYALRSDMHGVYDCLPLMQGYQVQFILADFNDRIDLANTFDLGLSRITYDGNKLYLHPDFVEDSDAKQFRILRADDDGQTIRSERRIDRLLTKYPDFKRAA